MGTFEEEYPRLEGCSGGVILDSKFVFNDKCKCWYNFQDIQKHCLDRDKVKEAIKTVLKKIHEDEWQDYRCYFSELEVELGLE